jgi:molybdopterin synthase catalytic subunit
MIDIRIQKSNFDPGRQLARLEELHAGAVASVVALVEVSEGAGAVMIDHYPAMAKSELARIAGEAEERWPLTGIILIFRHGRLLQGDRFALIATGARGSAAALEACAYLREQLNARAPFWQREFPAEAAARAAKRLPAAHPREA